MVDKGTIDGIMNAFIFTGSLMAVVGTAGFLAQAIPYFAYTGTRDYLLLRPVRRTEKGMTPFSGKNQLALNLVGDSEFRKEYGKILWKDYFKKYHFKKWL